MTFSDRLYRGQGCHFYNGFFSYPPLMPRGHILSLPPEKGCKESAKGEIMASPFEPPTRPLRRAP